MEALEEEEEEEEEEEAQFQNGPYTLPLKNFLVAGPLQ